MAGSEVYHKIADIGKKYARYVPVLVSASFSFCNVIKNIDMVVIVITAYVTAKKV